MKVAWATDVHLEFIPHPRVFYEELRDLGADAILLTGDIAVAPELPEFLRELGSVVGRPALFVLGNHDYYGGSIEVVRAWAAEETRRDNGLIWMPEAGVVPLTDRVAAVGVDGWGDGRLGDPLGSDVYLSDWVAIEDLRVVDLDERTRTERILPRLRELGDGEAEALREPLREAAERFPEVLVLTHVPPFREAAWHQGEISDDAWLPWFSCEATGKVLLDTARSRPDVRFTVLCGHTHGEGRAEMLPNLVVLTGGARYGDPSVAAVLDLSGEPDAYFRR